MVRLVFQVRAQVEHLILALEELVVVELAELVLLMEQQVQPIQVAVVVELAEMDQLERAQVVAEVQEL